VLESVGGSANQQAGTSNERIIKQLQARQARWKVLEDDSEDEDGNVKVVLEDD
jgi:hypothetical protein